MENPSEQQVRVSLVVRHIEKAHGLGVTRQTVYNWIKSGVGGIKLRSQVTPIAEQPHRFHVSKRGHYLTTSIAWVDEFLAAISHSPLNGGR
jgi:hypothetical protein